VSNVYSSISFKSPFDLGLPIHFAFTIGTVSVDLYALQILLLVPVGVERISLSSVVRV
jgi:hypothetical protein